jgi:hypothetical protein
MPEASDGVIVATNGGVFEPPSLQGAERTLGLIEIQPPERTMQVSISSPITTSQTCHVHAPR